MIKKFKYTITICPATINAMENLENNFYKNNLSEKNEKSKNTKSITESCNYSKKNNDNDFFKLLKKIHIEAFQKKDIKSIAKINEILKNKIEKLKNNQNCDDNSIHSSSEKLKNNQNCDDNSIHSSFENQQKNVPAKIYNETLKTNEEIEEIISNGSIINLTEKDKQFCEKIINEQINIKFMKIYKKIINKEKLTLDEIMYFCCYKNSHSLIETTSENCRNNFILKKNKDGNNLYQRQEKDIDMYSSVKNSLEKIKDLEFVQKQDNGNSYIINNKFVVKDDSNSYNNKLVTEDKNKKCIKFYLKNKYETKDTYLTKLLIYENSISIGNDNDGYYGINLKPEIKKYSNNELNFKHNNNDKNNKNLENKSNTTEFFEHYNSENVNGNIEDINYDNFIIHKKDNIEHIIFKTNENFKIYKFGKENTKKKKKKKNISEYKNENIFTENKDFFTTDKKNKCIYTKNSSLNCYYSDLAFHITYIDNNNNISLMSADNQIKIVLSNEKDVLILNLFLDDDTKNKYPLSYFKDSVDSKISKSNQSIKLDFTNSNIYHVTNGELFFFDTKDKKTKANFFYNDVMVNCYLKGDNSKFLFQSCPNKSILTKNLDKDKEIIFHFSDGVTFSSTKKTFYNNNTTLYNLDDNRCIIYYDMNLKVKIHYNVYNKIKITDENDNEINFEQYLKKLNLNEDILKEYYKNYIEKFIAFRNYYDILGKLYKDYFNNDKYNDTDYKYKTENIYTIFEKIIAEYNNTNKINVKESNNKKIEINKEYSGDYLLDLIKNSCFYNDLKCKYNKNADYKAIFVTDLCTNNNSLKKFLIDETHEENKNIIDILNSNEPYCVLELIYDILNNLNYKDDEALVNNLKGIIHKDYDHKLRLYYMYDYQNKICYIYHILTHTEAGFKPKS